MNTIDIQGKSYSVKPFDEFTFADCRRIAENWERVADRLHDDEEFFEMVRTIILILSPLAAQDDHRWTRVGLMNAVPLLMERLGELMTEWSELWKRCGSAADIVHQRFFPHGSTADDIQ